MRVILTLGLLLASAGFLEGRPQYSYPVPTGRPFATPTTPRPETQTEIDAQYIPPPRTPCVPVGTVKPRQPFDYQVDAQGRPRGTLGAASVQCSRREVSPGKYQFACDGADPRQITLSTEHILWLCPPESSYQQVDVVVPNYRVEELIRAALKQSSVGQTSVNILLKKPETVYDVQAQEGASVGAGRPSVNLQYEAVREPLSVHYPVDQPYNQLLAPIREP